MDRHDIQQIRAEIDQIDSELVCLIAKRRAVSLKIAEFKKKRGLPIKDEKREALLLNKVQELAKSKNIDQALIEKIFLLVIADSVKLQEELLGA